MSDPGCQKNGKPAARPTHSVAQFCKLAKSLTKSPFCPPNSELWVLSPKYLHWLPSWQNSAKPRFLRDPSKTRVVQKMAKLDRKTSQKVSTFHIVFNFHHNSCRFQAASEELLSSIICQNFCEHIAFKLKCQRLFILLSFFFKYIL